jgi:UDP-glucose 4-epimerase
MALFVESQASYSNSPILRSFTPSDNASVNTPATERSVLFDEPQSLLESLPETDSYILVVGGLGYIGSHTCLELLKANYNVVIIDNLANAFSSVFDRVQRLAQDWHCKHGTPMPSVSFHEIDYRDSVAMKALLKDYAHSVWGSHRSKISGVIHFAAHKAVEESIKNPLKYYKNNVSGMIDFTSTLEDFGIKTFIFSSSATVYGTIANTGVPMREEHCVHRPSTMTDHAGVETKIEQGCTGITNPYGRTKWMCEAILADLAYSDPDWTIVALRYFNPVGCDESGHLGEDPKGIPSNLLPVVTQVVTGQRAELQMFGDDYDTPDGTAVRDFIHVSDLARGHIAALARATEGSLKENFRTFNLGTGCGNTVLDVVGAMENASQKTISRRPVGRRPGDVGSCVAEAKRAQNELCWKTEKSLDDSCRDIINFLKVSEQQAASSPVEPAALPLEPIVSIIEPTASPLEPIVSILEPTASPLESITTTPTPQQVVVSA